MSRDNMTDWLSISEDAVLFYPTINRICDLLEGSGETLPTNVQFDGGGDFESCDVNELSNSLISFCNQNINPYKSLTKFRVSGLRSLWRAREKKLNLALEQNLKDVVAKKDSTTAPSETTAIFSSKLSLMLLFPLIESQARIDTGLCLATTNILLQNLRECPPFSLREPVECLDGIENLLCSWLGEDCNGTMKQVNRNPSEVSTIASTLVALACARDNMRTVLHTIYILKQLPTITSLPVNDLINILSGLEGGPTTHPYLQNTKHKKNFLFTDPLAKLIPVNQPVGEDKETGKRTVTTDGTFIYISNLTGGGITKLGTGNDGTIQSYVYASKSCFAKVNL
jgi:E3 ubiquitin-protein ligase HECTD4